MSIPTFYNIVIIFTIIVSTLMIIDWFRRRKTINKCICGNGFTPKEFTNHQPSFKY